MFFERDFQVKQEQINDHLRQRALERQVAQANRRTVVQQIRRSRQLVGRLSRRLLPAGARPMPTGTTEPC